MAEAVSGGFMDACVYLREQAFRHVDEMYGPGGSKPLAYHNLGHTAGIVRDVKELSKLALARELIVPRQAVLLEVAGAFHDYVHGEGSGTSEELSATAALNAMSATECFSIQDKELVFNAIMATVVHSDEHGRFVQSASPGDYPSQLLADADLASLGKPTREFWARVGLLYEEYYPAGQRDSGTFLAFNQRQVHFLSGHHYYTAEARQLFPYQSLNLESVHQAITDVPAPPVSPY